MHTNLRSLLLVSTAVSVLLGAAPVHAATGEQAEIKELQTEIKALQSRLDSVSQAQQQTQAAVAAAPAPAATTTTTTTTTASTGGLNGLQSAIYQNTGVKLTLGGFFDATGIYRSKSEAADSLSNFNGSIPFNNSVNSHQSEFRGTARSTRLSLLAEGNPNDNTHLFGYIETDFLGAAPTANSVETNGYTPRIRQGFVGMERNDLGFNVYAGQMWSLATLYKSGLTPRQEALPPTIEIGLLPGFTYTRTPELRLDKTFLDNKVTVAFAADSPQTNFGGITAPGNVTATNGPTTSSFAAAPSTEVAPDLIAKVAVDPGYGHYEAFGITRFFHDNVDATLHNNTVIGGGGGVGAVLPVVDKLLSVQGNAMVGSGIGRYGPALLPDYAFAPNGSIKTLNEYMGSVGLVGTPDPTWLTYLYAGGEKVMRYNTNTAGATIGYGNFDNTNAGCYVENGACTNAETSSVWDITGGFWHDLYKGNAGNLKVGLQDAILRRNAFSDSHGSAPHSYEDIAMVSFRYSPF